MSLDDYAVSYNVSFCWALRLSQVLAFSECPIDSQAVVSGTQTFSVFARNKIEKENEGLGIRD